VERGTYYETIGGGQGASVGERAIGVHVGMSNTRNTPVDVLEMEVSAAGASLRASTGSGGVGKW